MSNSTRTCSDISRRSADYHPSVWGDHFIQYALKPTEVDETKEKEIITLIEKVRKMLLSANDDTATTPIPNARLLDSIQRLGIYYHFEQEIGNVLRHIHNKYVENGIINLSEDVGSLALIFRLLRQKGYNVSPDIFKRFKNEEGKFNETLFDADGMLSFYEAAHLRVHGEEILDEAFAFTSSQLVLMIPQLSPSVAAKVNHSLKRPLHLNIPRLVAVHYISAYEEDPSHDKTLLLLAKLDFNMLQRKHQKEVGIISKWWKDLDFATKLPFARDRMVEVYFWMMGLYFEPQYSLGRRIMTKVICITSIIDDIYDVYGTLEELELFTEAVHRWDINCLNFLPEYMKYCYQALLDVYEEIELEVAKEGRVFCVTYAKDEMKRLVQSYFEEAKWCNKKYVPTIEEYMDVALVSSGYYMLIATAFVGMGHIATQKTFEWFTNNPKIVKAANVIARVMDDIASSEFEQKTGQVASAVECYMKQHNVTREEAVEKLSIHVINGWKDINEECLDPTQVSKSLLFVVLNLTRVIHVLYRDGDGYTHSDGSTKKDIASLLLNPWQI